MGDQGDNVEDFFKQAQAPPPSGGEPPPQVAKADANKLMIVVPIAIFLVIFIGGYFLLGGSKKTKVQVYKVASEFLLDVGQNQYPKAYAQFATAYRNKFTLEAMSATWAGDPQHWLIDECEFADAQFPENLAVVRCKATVTTNRVKNEVYIDVKLIQDAGAWKVIGFSFP